MKKKLLFLITMLFCVVGFTTSAQIAINCKLKANFKFQSANCKVQFIDVSIAGAGATVSSWSWDFGDATTSTLQNPGHVYAASGTYTVCLTVTATNVLGVKCKDKICLPVTITGCGETPPCRLAAKFDFKADKCTIGFSDYSAAGAGTTITNWYWDFGDATTSNLQNPTHTYTTSGTYNVCLTIVGNNGFVKCKDQFCLPITVKGCEPVIHCGVKPLFEFKTDKCTAYFTDFSGTNSGTTITNWYWSFGDATTSTLQNPIHVYAASGTYTVCLITVAINTAGEQCKNKICFPVKVEGCKEIPPCKLAANFKFKTDKCYVGFADLSAVGIGTTITNWYWDFGDATTSTLQNPTHVYATAGAYNVCLIIVGTNAAGVQCKDKICNIVKVDGCGHPEPCKLASKFDFKVDKCKVGFFDLSAAGSGTTITNWYWDFGDATTSTLQNPIHVYATAGVYKVCLVIVGTNAAGEQCKDRVCQEIKVEGCETRPCEVNAKFDFKIDKCNVYFADFSATGSGTIITNWYWNFGDGGTSTLQNPVHAYAATGNYKVCLIVVGKNAAGKECKDELCLEVKVDCKLPGYLHNNRTSLALSVFPNPTSDLVNINFKMLQEGQSNVTVTDMQGRELFILQDGKLSEGYHTISWKIEANPGWYIITVRTAAGIEQKPVLLQP